MASIASGDAIRINWRDSKGVSGWVPSNYTFTPGTVMSLGYVVKSTKEGLTIASSICQDPPIVHEPFTIPWGAIEEWEILEGIEVC